jgi:hypothetical protein
MHHSSPPYVPHSPPISFFLIYPNNIWWVGGGVVGWGTASHDARFRIQFLVRSLDLENFPSYLFLPSAFSSPLNRKWVTRYFLGGTEWPARGANNSADLVVPNVKVRTKVQNSTPPPPLQVSTTCYGKSLHLTILGENYWSLSFLLCRFRQSSVIFSLFRPKFLCTLFSNILSLRSSFNLRDKVSHPYKTTGKIIILHKYIFVWNRKTESSGQNGSRYV